MLSVNMGADGREMVRVEEEEERSGPVPLETGKDRRGGLGEFYR